MAHNDPRSPEITRRTRTRRGAPARAEGPRLRVPPPGAPLRPRAEELALGVSLGGTIAMGLSPHKRPSLVRPLPGGRAVVTHDCPVPLFRGMTYPRRVRDISATCP